MLNQEVLEQSVFLSVRASYRYLLSAHKLVILEFKIVLVFGLEVNDQEGVVSPMQYIGLQFQSDSIIMSWKKNQYFLKNQVEKRSMP